MLAVPTVVQVDVFTKLSILYIYLLYVISAWDRNIGNSDRTVLYFTHYKNISPKIIEAKRPKGSF
jgi:hypothetical protein